MFADRASFDLTPNDFSRRLASRRASGPPFLDLAETNPTRCGFRAPADAMREALLALCAEPGALVYEPDSRGLPAARSAIANDLATRGLAIDPSQLVLTAGTSEACAHLFRLLADPGDEILVPRPGYPLFDQLAELEGLAVRSYALRREARGGYAFDLEAVAQAIGPRTRIVVVVHPSNPTGTRVSREDATRLRRLCRERDLALLVDEVFADFVLDDDPRALPSFLLGADHDEAPLGFVLSGVSKALALPQWKLAWIAVTGPRALREQALARLEVIADAFLSVTTPGQWSLPALLGARERVQAELLDRLRTNRETLARAIASEPALRLLPVAAGWSAILEVPRARTCDEDSLVCALLDEADLLLQPGWLFDLEAASGAEDCAQLVASLLPEPSIFAAASARLVAPIVRFEHSSRRTHRRR